jgi:hypothetical protein
MSALTIPADVAAELYELDDNERDSSGAWTRIADQIIDSGRWLERRWLVVSNGEGVFGVRYADGLTEEQEHERPWEDDGVDAIELTPLVGVPVTTTTYLTGKQYEAHLAKGGSDG